MEFIISQVAGLKSVPLVKTNFFTGILPGFYLLLGVLISRNIVSSCFLNKFVYHFAEKNNKQLEANTFIGAIKKVKEKQNMPPKNKVKTDDTHLALTDDEKQMLLETTRDFKLVRAYEGVDWESGK